jgi:hypothetical protein
VSTPPLPCSLEALRGAGRPAPGPSGGRPRERAVARLLADLGAGLRRGGAGSAPATACRWPTGLPEVDRLLGGGLPGGSLSEIAGPHGCGRTSLALALLAATTTAGHLAAVLDAADAFDPPSAAAGGTDLARVLWVRPPGLREALRGAEHVLAAGGFALVVLDLAHGAAPAVPTAAWTRLRRLAAGHDAALVVLSRRRLAGSFADLALELDPARPRFALRDARSLEGIEAHVRIARHRAGLRGAAAVCWHAVA